MELVQVNFECSDDYLVHLNSGLEQFPFVVVEDVEFVLDGNHANTVSSLDSNEERVIVLNNTSVNEFLYISEDDEDEFIEIKVDEKGVYSLFHYFINENGKKFSL